jgi:hypothetical protein
VDSDAFCIKERPSVFPEDHGQDPERCAGFARYYINNIIIFSKSHAEYKMHLREVFQRLMEKGIKCHPKKLRCIVKDASYLGHLVGPNGTAPQDVKVEAITKMVAPTDVRVEGLAWHLQLLPEAYKELCA